MHFNVMSTVLFPPCVFLSLIKIVIHVFTNRTEVLCFPHLTKLALGFWHVGSIEQPPFLSFLNAVFLSDCWPSLCDSIPCLVGVQPYVYSHAGFFFFFFFFFFFAECFKSVIGC